MKEIEKLKAVFLSLDEDDEIRADNAEKIAEWEKGLAQNEAFASWKELDITQQILQKAKETYKATCTLLVWSRDLTDQERMTVYAKQDAALWLISLIDVDAKAALAQIKREVHIALNATS